MAQAPDGPIEFAAVLADDELVEAIINGHCVSSPHPIEIQLLTLLFTAHR